MDADTHVALKSAIRKKRLSGQWTIEQCFSIFEGLTDYLNKVETQKRRMKKIITGSFVIAVVLIFVSIGLVSSSQYIDLIFPILMFAGFCAVLGIVTGLLNMIPRGQGFQEDYQSFLLPLLKSLEEDIKSGSPLTIDFYLSPIIKRRFYKGRGAKYKKGAYHSCRDYNYERILLRLKLRLHDGNRLMLTLHERFVKTKKAKWSSSRKYKTKTTFKQRQTFDIRVLVNPEKFSCAPLPSDSDLGFYEKQRNGVPLIGMRFKENLKWAFERNRPKLKPSRTIRHLVLLYARVQPKTSAPETNA